MTDIVQPDSYFPDRRPSLLRRVVGRYQLAELTIIIGAILLCGELFRSQESTRPCWTRRTQWRRGSAAR
ncbi:MAG TPA: hypothetical protein VED46_15270 [Alphaproteobacteria bacterium]|nr:hypothetical protein [Alphaproteobacteria bacterium]